MIMLIIIFIFGLAIGSFLNVLIWRVKTGRSFVVGRSICPKCQKEIRWYDNIPLLSFVLLRAKCRKCKKNISIQYPLVELTAAMLFTFVFIRYFDLTANYYLPLTTYFLLFRDWFFVSVLIIIFVFDLLYYLIPDKITIPAIVAGVIFILIQKLAEIYTFIPVKSLPISSYIFGMFLGGGFFLAQFLISRGKWIGGGDIRLGVLMGLILGLSSTLVALFIAYLLGSVVGIFLILLHKKKWRSQMPFGAFLTVGTLIALFWGQIIWQWYWRI